CSLCGDMDTQEDFPWACPPKQQVWQTVAARFLQTSLDLRYLHLSSLSGPCPAVLAAFSVPFHAIVACTLLAIWRAHWQVVFDERHFWPNEVAAQAMIIIRRIHAGHSLNYARPLA
ncbi:hypothetical protein BX666DRAFT_1857919, partial [Dichotomocladium elegans]